MNNRDLMYQNYQAGAFNTPAPQVAYAQTPYLIPGQPSGYVTNMQTQAFGPNVVPEQTNYVNDNIDLKINQIERKILSLENRVKTLETQILNTDVIDNTYII